MRSYEDRLRLKNHFFKLGQGRIIELDHISFWQHLWKEPEESSDIYELLTPNDIRTIRDQNRINFLSLIRILSEKVVEIVENDQVLPRTSDLLNCIRFLTKLIPFLYEIPEYIEEVENDLFWANSYDPIDLINKSKPKTAQSPKILQINTNKQTNDTTNSKDQKTISPRVLGVSLLRSILKLLFYKGFTVDASIAKKTASSLWEPGIGGSSAKYSPPNSIIDANRTEVLRLLLTLLSNSLYQLPSQIIASGSKFLTLLVVASPRLDLLNLVCSLFNILCRSARSPTNDNGLVFENADLIEQRYMLVTYSSQLLALMIGYPLPSSENLTFLSDLNVLSDPRPINLVRLSVGKLHKETELLYLYSYLVNILKLPIQRESEEGAKFTIVKASVQPSLWALESVILLWELLQCNKTFRNLVSTRFADELIIVLVYYISSYHGSSQHRNLVRLCSYIILYLSSDLKLSELIFSPIKESFYQSLPLSFKTSSRPITTRDFVVNQICSIVEASVISTTASPSLANGIGKPSSDVLLITLVEILHNLISPVSARDLKSTNDESKKMSNFNAKGGLSYSACWSITQVITKLSTKTFLQEKPFNPDLLALLVRGVCAAVLKHPKSSRMLLYSILKNEKTYDEVWNVVHGFESIKEEEEPSDPEDNNDNTEPAAFEVDEASLRDDASTISVKDIEQSPQIPSQPNSNPQSNRNSITIDPSVALDYKVIEDSLRSKLPTGMSEKAREKLPINSPMKRTWGGTDSLRIILTIVIPRLKESLEDLWNPSPSAPKTEAWILVKHIEGMDLGKLIELHKPHINYDFLPETPLETLKFNWSHLSLGWYLSLLYGDIYNSIHNVKEYTGGNNKIMKNITSSLASVSKITSSWTSFIKTNSNSAQSAESARTNEWVQKSLTGVNQWSSTSIKLFRIETAQNDGILGRLGSFNQAAPGTPGMNGMANNLVRRFSDFKVSNNSRTSVSSGMNTPVEEQEFSFARNPHRASVSSLHSLNTLNRSRSNTPRNSIAM